MHQSSLSEPEMERYARHIIMREIGGPGQHRLKNARVLVIGAGGLGSPLLQYLAAAGVGTIDIVYHDIVTLSNLQRQVIHGTPDIGMSKVASAAKALERINPHVNVIGHDVQCTNLNVEQLVASSNIVIDGSDNFSTRYLVSDTCYQLGKPLVTAALGVFDASLTTIRAHETDPNGKKNPTYRCLFPTPPPPGTIPACSEAGVLGALAGMMGSMMAIEVIRQIVGFGEGLVGRLLMVDVLDMRFETITYEWDPNNILNGSGR